MIEIIPAIDLIDGKCVRLSQGDYARKKVYNENPLEVAKMFEDQGIRRLHLVDLDGAKAQHVVNHAVLEQIVTNTHLIVDFGGGIKSDADIELAFSSGAHMVTGGSIAVKQPDLFISWLERYGADQIILGADVRDRMISISGWTETSGWELMPFLEKYIGQGVQKVICTDIAKDGMLTGASIDLYRDILQQFPDLYLVASGGVDEMQNILDLEAAGVPAVITGKAIYEGRITMQQISQYICK